LGEVTGFRVVGRDFLGWSVNYWEEQMDEVTGEVMSTPFDLVLGRKTYDILPPIGRTPRRGPAPSH
jgi:hypothetical protein